MIIAKQYDINIESGADFFHQFRLRDDEENLVDLTGATVTAQLREYSEAQDYFLFTATHNGEGGTVFLTMPHESTAAIGYTAGYYDVFVDYPDETREKVLWGQVVISPAVTRPVDGSIMYLLSFASEENFPEEGMTGRVYMSFETGMIYRWNGTAYIGITTQAPSAWGTITGDITEQEDLQTALDEKEDTLTFDTAPTNGSTNPVTSGGVATALASKADANDLADAVADIDNLTLDKADIIATSATGSMVSITDAGEYPATALSVDIEPVQDLSNGDPSPDNICPITGHTQAVVQRTGKNLLDENGFEIGKYITQNGNIAVGNTNICYALYVPLKKNQNYVVSAKQTIYNIGVCLYNTQKSVLRRYNNNNKQSILIESSTEDRFVRFWFDFDQTIADSTSYSKIAPQLELGSTATSYEPYQGQTLSVTFPTEAGTVYGGTLDVTNGVLTVDRAIYTIDENHPITGFVSDSANGSYGEIVLSNVLYLQNKVTVIGSLCEGITYENRVNSNYVGKTRCYVGANARIYFRASKNETITSINELNALFDGCQIVYTLATPITYTLTPQQMTLLLGENHIWADTGDVTVDYRADTKLYIDKKFAELQALILEN